jgi:TctA family transporter
LFDVMENLYLGFETALTLTNLALCLLGVTLGTLIGVLPGLGPMTTISLLLPFTYGVGDPTGSLIFLAGIYYGSQYGGSITAILLRLPGESSSTVTVLDGYAMTQRGQGGAALTITALASFMGGTVSTVVIAVLAAPLSEIAFWFGPAEYASLMLLGMLASISITEGGFLRGLSMIGLGAFLGLVGTNINTGQTRFTADIVYLVDGISFPIMAIGIFGVGEILYNMLRRDPTPSCPAAVSSLYPTIDQCRQAIAPAGRGTLVGTVLGLLPGGGATLSSFLSYALERRISREPHTFGKGAMAGLAGPEAANNASAQSQFLPTLMLGLPITPVMSMMIAVLIINGIQPGPNVISNTPSLFWGLIASMWIGNVILVILNIPLIGVWVTVLKTPKWILNPLILVIAVFGAYSINNSWFDILLLAIFGVLGFGMRWLRFEPAPLALTFIVAPLFEEYLNRALLISNGDWITFIEKPISLMLIIVSLITVITSIVIKSKSRLNCLDN